MPRTDLCGFVQGTTEIQLVRVAQHTDIEAESGKPQEVVPREISYLVMSYEPSPFGRKGQGPSARLLRHCSRCGWKSHAFPFYDQVYVMMIIYEEELWPPTPLLSIYFSYFFFLSFSRSFPSRFRRLCSQASFAFGNHPRGEWEYIRGNKSGLWTDSIKGPCSNGPQTRGRERVFSF